MWNPNELFVWQWGNPLIEKILSGLFVSNSCQSCRTHWCHKIPIINWNNETHTCPPLSTQCIQSAAVLPYWSKWAEGTLRAQRQLGQHVYATGTLICKYSISTHHWGSGVCIELQIIYVRLAWGAGKTSHSLWSPCVLSGNEKGHCHIILISLSLSMRPCFHLMRPAHLKSSGLKQSTVSGRHWGFVWAFKQENYTVSQLILSG